MNKIFLLSIITLFSCKIYKYTYHSIEKVYFFKEFYMSGTTMAIGNHYIAIKDDNANKLELDSKQVEKINEFMSALKTPKKLHQQKIGRLNLAFEVLQNGEKNCYVIVNNDKLMNISKSFYYRLNEQQLQFFLTLLQ